MSSALVLLFDGVEEIEAISAIDVLRRGRIDVTTASIKNATVTGAHQIKLTADIVGIPQNVYDAVVIPGGPGILALRHNAQIENLIQQQYESSRLVAAICAAPIILNDLGILEKHRYTAHASMINELPNARLHEMVVTDGHVITACGPAAGVNFGLAILKYLTTVDLAKGVAHAMMCDTSL